MKISKLKTIVATISLGASILSCSSCGSHTSRYLDVAKAEMTKVMDVQRLVAPDGSKRVVQGMDIHGDELFIGFDGGYCRIVNLLDGSTVREFPLGSNVPSNHCGNLDFGLEIPEGSEYPALYVSGDLSTFSCYVEKITPDGAELIQTIRFKLKNGFNGSQVIIDSERECIWYQQRKLNGISDAANTAAIYRFRLPKLSEGPVVTFSDADALEYFELEEYKRLYQGADITSGVLYLVNGYKTTFDKAAELTLFDMRASSDNKPGRKLTSRDISHIGREPQGCSFHGSDLYLLFDNQLWVLK